MASYRKTPPVPVKGTYELVELTSDDVWVLFYAVSDYTNSGLRGGHARELQHLLDKLTDDL